MSGVALLCGVGPGLVDAVARILTVMGNLVDRRILGPSVKREIHWRLLTGPPSGKVAALTIHPAATDGGTSSSSVPSSLRVRVGAARVHRVDEHPGVAERRREHRTEVVKRVLGE